jgi:alkylation response protein AidB-like acyl-CoA dehydrogenase
VPASRRLGELNQGWKALMRGLNLERLCLSASAIGNIRRIIDYARDFALQRTQFGKPLTEHQAIAHKFAEMQVMYETGVAAVHRTADMLDAGLAPALQASAAKVYCTESNIRCADIGMQILGGAAWMMDHEMQMYYRDCRVGTIGGGTTEIMKNIIAKQMEI